MNDISLQAVQFIPRFTSVAILVSITWIVALIAKSMVLRAACNYQNDAISERLQRGVSIFVFWAIIMVMAPFILGAAGLDANWLDRAQSFVGQLFSHWPIWMLLSVILAVVSHLVRTVPKFNPPLKSSSGSTSKEVQN
ncbi:hypothetical protein ACFLXI_01125 [Chloroflexota bacterium]